MIGRRAAGEQDEADFRAFVDASHRSLLRTAWLLTGDRWLAEDLVQTAFTATYLHWRGIEVPEAYARTALLRDAVRGRRRRALEQPKADLPEVAVPDTGDRSDTIDAVRHALSRCRSTSAPCSSFATGPAGQRPRSRRRWAAARAPSRAAPPVPWRRFGALVS